MAQQQRTCLPVWNQETQVSSLSWEDPLEKEMWTHSNILVWEISRTEEPGRLPSVSPRVRPNLATQQQQHNTHPGKRLGCDVEMGSELSLDTCQRESLRGFCDWLGAGSRLVRRREDCRIVSDRLSSWVVVVPLVLGKGTDSMGWWGVEAKVLPWPFNSEISLNIQIVPSGQEIMVTSTRTEVVEVGNGGTKVCSSWMVILDR